MGRDKGMLRDNNGHTFLEIAVSRLQDRCPEVCLCGSSRQSQLPFFHSFKDVAFLKDKVDHSGPASGIAVALDHASRRGFAACLINAVDMPDLRIEDLIMLEKQWLQHPQQIVCAVDERNRRTQPLVAIYPVSVTDAVSRLAASEQRSLSCWLERQLHHRVILPSDSMRNVNSPGDWIERH